MILLYDSLHDVLDVELDNHFWDEGYHSMGLNLVGELLDIENWDAAELTYTLSAELKGK
jgi:hypothetical protein